MSSAAAASVLVTARNEADRLGETLIALEVAFPASPLIVADDASTDGTAEVAAAAGADVVGAPSRLGKGGVATLGARRLDAVRLAGEGTPIVVLCDGDLGASARQLRTLAEAVERGEAELAVAAFSHRRGGGFGIALGFARWAVRRLTGLELRAPISGQRALRADVLEAVLPFAAGFGMEIGMIVDAHRAGFRVVEIELDLTHRATGRTTAGFVHRARQLWDFVRVYASRR